MHNKNTIVGEFWRELENDKVQCDLCPRRCQLQNGQRGFCYVRANQNQQVVLNSYGLSSGFCIDPIEKKPLNHFYPGTSVLSFGTAGCNLACKFCQNWDISKSREIQTLSAQATPEQIAQSAKRSGCQSVAYTYNDPVIFYEYVKDTAIAFRELNISSVAVTAGYITNEARADFFKYIDATNVDLKAFSEKFYNKVVGGSLAPVLETLKYLKNHTEVWFEITTLLIPEENDSEEELQNMTQWIVENLGNNVPLHFSAFHPDYKMRQKTHTRLQSLKRAREIAMQNGLHYVYTGNLTNTEGETTFCGHCQSPLIIRDRYNIVEWNLQDGHCPKCHNQ
ncbi:MAG: AmmeMemoRadiSam system radical SAM enzyme, partial [Bdellovibrionales bacterium]|nr:AmmeMemoRadiSam system radical SAM enzyme [Bdellovibrionales bacterium]